MTGRDLARVVSRNLAAAGQRPLASGMRGRREGITVTGGMDNTAYVSVDLDSLTAAKRRCDDVQEILEAEGYQVTRTRDSGLTVTVPTKA